MNHYTASKEAAEQPLYSCSAINSTAWGTFSQFYSTSLISAVMNTLERCLLDKAWAAVRQSGCMVYVGVLVATVLR